MAYLVIQSMISNPENIQIACPATVSHYIIGAKIC